MFRLQLESLIYIWIFLYSDRIYSNFIHCRRNDFVETDMHINWWQPSLCLDLMMMLDYSLFRKFSCIFLFSHCLKSSFADEIFLDRLFSKAADIYAYSFTAFSEYSEYIMGCLRSLLYLSASVIP